MKTEFECRFANINIDDMRQKLSSLGFELIEPEHLMRRKVFGLPNIDGAKRYLRLRDAGNEITLTLKLKGAPTSASSMKEIEVPVGDFDLMSELLESSDIPLNAYEENRREKWTKDNVEVCLDTWPGLNPFAEIESDSEDAVRIASAELGFDYNDAMFGNVIEVYETVGITMEDVWKSCTFEKPPKSNA